MIQAPIRKYLTAQTAFGSRTLARFRSPRIFGSGLRAAFALALAAVLFAGGDAEARSITIERFAAEIVVLESAVIRVRETITARFEGQWNGIFRTIPVEYRTPQGFSYRLDLRPAKATDENGEALKLESERDRHYRKIKIWVPGAENARRTVTLEYRVENGLKFFADHDELYWNVTGDEWDMPIAAASAEILLPEGAQNVRATAFTGAYGSTAGDADVDVDGSTVRARMRRELGFREGLTLAVAWAKGAVQEPSAWKKGQFFLRANWPFFVPMAVFALMAWLWHHHGRDPRLKPVVARYEPPDGMTPAEVGTLADDAPDLRDVTATLVDLAVRGFIRIEEIEEEKLLGLWSSKGYQFELRIPKSRWTGLLPHEKELLESVFAMHVMLLDHEPALPRVRTSDLENKFYKNLPDIRSRIYERLLERGCYDHRPDHVRRFYGIIAAVVAGATIFASSLGSVAFAVAPLTLVIAGLASAAIIFAFGWFMPARTARGATALEGVLGFEEFLGRVEGDRMDRMIRTPETFEKFLPYAMALGVEKNWAKAFEDICDKAPEWYRGGSPGAFRVHHLTAGLGRMSSAAGAAMASAPRSSGGSGFGGGGGRSGGGFGGGGGGGF